MMLKLGKRHLCTMGLVIGIVMASTPASAQTRNFLFHMSTVYAHGNTPNCGYAASKADNEQYACITVNQFTKTGSPTISMWVAPNGGYSEQTNPWSWTSTAGTLKFHYTNWQNAGSSHQLCAEQFGSGSAVIGGRWTP